MPELTRQDSKATTSGEAMRSGIEAYIDSAGMEDFLTTLSMICADKAEHIATNWQDATLAKQWMTLADRIGLLIGKAKGL